MFFKRLGKSKLKNSTKFTIGGIAGSGVGGLVALVVVVYVIYACNKANSLGERLKIVFCLCRCLMVGQ